MKRKLLWCLALTGLLVTTSCSQDETVDEPTPQRHAIGFSSFIDKPTRAGEDEEVANTDNMNFNSFQVWAFETPKGPDAPDGTATWLPGNFVLENVTIQKNADGAWDYAIPSNKTYWSPGSSYAFLAVGPTNFITQTTGEYGNIISVIPVTNVENTNMQSAQIIFENRVGTVDVVAALNQSFAGTPWVANTSDKTVNFKFGHILSRIHFAFTNNMDDGSKLEISDVQITNSTRKGKAFVSLNSDGNTIAMWEQTLAETQDVSPQYSQLMFAGAINVKDGENPDDVFEDINTSGYYINSGKTAYTKSLLIIPDNNVALRVKFTIKHKKGKVIKSYNKDVAITAPVDDWKSGYCYLLSAEINYKNLSDKELEPIEFTATVDNWNTSDHNGGTINMDGTTPAPTDPSQPTPRMKRR